MSDCNGNSCCPEAVAGPFGGGVERGVKTCENYTVSKNVSVVDVTGEDVTITLPENPSPLTTVKVLASGGSVKVRGGCFPICGLANDNDADHCPSKNGCNVCKKSTCCCDDDEDGYVTIAGCRSGEFTFNSKCRWVPTLSS